LPIYYPYYKSNTILTFPIYFTYYKSNTILTFPIYFSHYKSNTISTIAPSTMYIFAVVSGPKDRRMASAGLYRLYLGNLPRDLHEDDILGLFQEHGLNPPLGVTLKPAGYAFVECPDQATFDDAIECLNGRATLKAESLHNQFFSKFLYS
jgi:RNA recognition motif-containing protein